MRRKIAVLTLLVFLCLLLTACGGFSIKGKWKSVGSEGFGQAQPGAIVIFEENNCNFFSPYDTYAFYKDGSGYKLETTSFLALDTLSFDVTVKDNNHITVYYGGQATELQRVQ